MTLLRLWPSTLADLLQQLLQVANQCLHGITVGGKLVGVRAQARGQNAH
jgi:hypothetical protein